MTEPSRHPITVDDLIDLATEQDAALSPDGRLALLSIGKRYGDKEKKAPRTIMAVPLDGGAPYPFTAGEAVDSLPRWSPDGATVAFLSDRPHQLPEDRHAAPTQVYLLRRDGGEARRLTAVGGEIHDLAWAPDGARLVLLMSEPETEQERTRHEERAGAIDVEERPRFWRLWGVDLATGELTPLTPEGLQVWGFGLALDGATAALVTSDLPYEWSWYQARLAVAALDGSPPRTIYAPTRQIANPRFSPDGATVALTSCAWSDRGYYGGDVLLVPAHGGEARNLTAGQPIAALSTAWAPDGRALLVSGYEEGESALWRLGLDGELRALWRAKGALPDTDAGFSRAGDTIVLLRSDPVTPADLWSARLEGDELGGWRRLTHLHPETEAWAVGETRTLFWAAPDGTPIQGLLLLPPGHESRRRLPLVTLVHGGPAGLYTYAFAQWWSPLLAAAGMAVLMPNPRGSTGWGTSFSEANLGDMGGADFGDIMAGIDHVVELGIADSDRLGIGGWSYGGFMTAWAVTQSDRFKAAVMGAGIADWRSFHGVTNIPTWDAIFYGPLGRPANPYALDGPYARFSPLTHIDRVRTPTLILHGERDECVPVGQGYQFFRALRDRGVPARMIVYPREGHGPRECAHWRDVCTQAVAWFQKYMVDAAGRGRDDPA